jgi:uncharacterized alpha-E superfamily protein
MLSRVVDSLYWMSRYLERAEHTARLIDMDLHGLIDQDKETTKKRHYRLMETLNCELEDVPDSELTYQMTKKLTLDSSNSASILYFISAARENARQIREQISTEMWEQLNRLYLFIKNSHMDDFWLKESHEFFMKIKEGSLLFQGITDSTMSHTEGWHFIHVGRYMERMGLVARILEVFLKYHPIDEQAEVPAEEYADWVGLLKQCTSFEAYYRHYRASLSSARIVDYLVLDSDFPHSIRFSAGMVKQALETISDLTGTRKFGHVNRLTGKLCASLDYASVEEIASDPRKFLHEIQLHGAKIHEAMYTTFITYPVETGT